MARIHDIGHPVARAKCGLAQCDAVKPADFPTGRWWSIPLTLHFANWERGSRSRR